MNPVNLMVDATSVNGDTPEEMVKMTKATAIRILRLDGVMGLLIAAPALAFSVSKFRAAQEVKNTIQATIVP